MLKPATEANKEQVYKSVNKSVKLPMHFHTSWLASLPPRSHMTLNVLSAFFKIVLPRMYIT